MSFKSEAAKVRAGISSGSYKKKSNPFAAFADEVAYGIRKGAEAQRQEEIDKRREARAEERRVKAAQDAADLKEKKIQRNAKALNLNFSGDPNNADAINFFEQQLRLMDGDVGDVTTLTKSMIDSNQLKFTKETESRELQGPLLRRSDVDLDVAQSSTYAAFKNARAKDDNETTTQILDTVDNLEELGGSIEGGMEKQMDAILGPEGENDASLEPVEIEKSGIELSPYTDVPADVSEFFKGIKNKADLSAKESQINAMPAGTQKTALLTALETIKKEPRFNQNPDDDPLKNDDGSYKSTEDLKKLANADPSLRAEVDKLLADPASQKFMTETITKTNIADFTANVTSELASFGPDDSSLTEDQLRKKLALAQRKSLLDQVQATYDAAEGDTSNDLKLTDKMQTVFLRPNPDTPNAEPIELYLAVMENGKFYDAVHGKTYGPSDIIKLGPRSDEVTAAQNMANRNTADFNVPLSDLKTDTTTLAQTALQLDTFAMNNPDILTFIGGKGSSLVKKVGEELEALANALGGEGLSDSEFAEEFSRQAAQKLQNLQPEDEESKSILAQNASAWAQWTALNIRHAFSFAKLALDSSGQALSNFDYKNALTINNVGTDYPTYTANLKTQTQNMITQAVKDYDQILNNSSEHNIAMMNPVYKQAFEATQLQVGINDHLNNNTPEVMQWLSSTAPVPSDQQTDETENNRGLGLNTYMNNPQLLDQDKIRVDWIRGQPEAVQGQLMDNFYYIRARMIFGPDPTPEQIQQAKSALDPLLSPQE